MRETKEETEASIAMPRPSMNDGLMELKALAGPGSDRERVTLPARKMWKRLAPPVPRPHTSTPD